MNSHQVACWVLGVGPFAPRPSKIGYRVATTSWLNAGRSVQDVLLHIGPAQLACKEAGWCPLPADAVEVCRPHCAGAAPP